MKQYEVDGTPCEAFVDGMCMRYACAGCVGKENCERFVTGENPETMELAKRVAEQPPLPDDEESIKKWAETLAADLAKFRD